MGKEIFLRLYLVIFFCFVLLSCTSSQKYKITIGIATWPGFAIGMVGQNKGIFKEKGLELEYRIIDDMPARHAAFRSGDLDIMISSVDLWTIESAQGIKGKAFLVTDVSWGGDGIVARKEIKSLRDLKGKRVAFARGTPSHFLLYKALKQAGLSPEDIIQVKVDDPGHAAQAFLGGSVDAAVTWEPFLTEVVRKGKGHILVTSRDIRDSIVDILVASEKLAANRELLEAFIEGWLASVEYVKAHPEEAARIIAEGLNVKPGDVEGMMAGLKLADREMNRYYFEGRSVTDSRLARIYEEAAAFWKSQGIIDHIVPAREVISETAFAYFNR